MLLQSNKMTFPELFDAFNVRNDPQGLNASELSALMGKVLPSPLTFRQLRYFMLLLDVNGDAAISLCDFRNVFHGFSSAGYILALRDEVRLEDALMRLAQRMRRGVSLQACMVERTDACPQLLVCCMRFLSFSCIWNIGSLRSNLV